MDKLTNIQRQVIYELFFKSNSVFAIAKKMHISMQEINMTKIRAFNNIKDYLRKDIGVI